VVFKALTFSATAVATNWFKLTPSLRARSSAARLIDSGKAQGKRSAHHSLN
jgi:hypothetical protein